MANEKYIKDTFKPDKLWACPSFTGSTFPGITPPAEGGGGMYQIGEDLNFTLGTYADGTIPLTTVNGNALYNAEYKAGAYVINKGYIFNYIGDSEEYHVFVNVRNGSALPTQGNTGSTAVDITCEVLAFMNQDETSIAYCYTCMPRGKYPDGSVGSLFQNINVNGVTFYCGDYINLLLGKVYQHIITVGNTGIELIIFSYRSTAFNKGYLILDPYYIVSGYYGEKGIPLAPIRIRQITGSSTLVATIPYAKITDGNITRASDEIRLDFNQYTDTVIPLRK